MTASVPLLRRWLAEASAVLAPVHCAGCGAPDEALCPACRRALVPGRVGVPPGTVGLLPAPAPVTAALEYGGVVARVLGALKEHDRTDLVGALAPALREAVEVALEGRRGVVLVAMPSSPEAVRRRGFRPVVALLRRAGWAPAGPRMLALTRPIDDQAGLSAERRRLNLHGAMAAGAGLAGHPVLLVDDVITTGSTLAEAARAVGAAGGTVIGAACLASTPRRLPVPGRPAGEQEETARK